VGRAGRRASGGYTGTLLWPMPPRRAPASWPAGRARLFGIDSHSRNSSRSWPSSSSSKASRHLRQEIGDPDARQHGVEARGKGLGFRRRRLLDRRDLQHTPVEHDGGRK